MPIPMKTPALAGAGAMDQVPMLRAVAARAAIQRRECSEIFLKLSIFGLRAEELRTPRAIWSKYAGSSPRQSPTRSMTPGREGVAVLQCSEGERSPCRPWPASDYGAQQNGA